MIDWLIDWPVVVQWHNYRNMTLLFGNRINVFQMPISNRIVWHSYSWKTSCVFLLVVCFGFVHKQGPVLLNTLILNVQFSLPRIVFWACCKKWQWEQISHYSFNFLSWLTKGFVVLWTFPKQACPFTLAVLNSTSCQSFTLIYQHILAKIRSLMCRKEILIGRTFSLLPTIQVRYWRMFVMTAV
jgi:hypothetical protein